MKNKKINSRNQQLKLLKDQPLAYGGELLKTRGGRAHRRPLSTRNTMHLVLRSTKATGHWSFWRHKRAIKQIMAKFAGKYGIKIVSMANVGNHLHFQIKLGNRHTYVSFIRALTSSIAMAVTGASRWHPLKKVAKDRFWDRRPFTRVVADGIRAFLALKNYIEINRLEGFGFKRAQAKFFLAWSDLQSMGAEMTEAKKAEV